MVEMMHKAIVGVLRKLVVSCCAFGVDLQRRPASRLLKIKYLKISKNPKKVLVL
jgi:hypothetical protein